MGSFPFTFLTGQQGGNLCLFTATVPCRHAALARRWGQLGARDSVSRRPWCPFRRGAQPLSPLTSSFPPLTLSCGLGQAPYAAGNGDYAIYYSADYAANYAAIIPIIPPFFKKGENFFKR